MPLTYDPVSRTLMINDGRVTYMYKNIRRVHEFNGARYILETGTYYFIPNTGDLSVTIDITGKKIKSAQLNEDELLLELDDGLLFVVSGSGLEYTTRKCLVWNWDGNRFWWWAVRETGLNYIINVNQDGKFRLGVSGDHFYFNSLQEAKDKAQEICNADLPAVLPNEHGMSSL